MSSGDGRPALAWEEPSAGLRPGSAALLLGGAVAGGLLAVAVGPGWWPGLAESLLGSSPKAYWYLSRASGLVAYALLWISAVLGLALTSRAARLWPGGPAAFDLHQFTGLLGLAISLFHTIVLLGDGYTGFTLLQILLPFADTPYRPLWVGMGQVGLYLGLAVGLSFYVRQRIGPRTWRLLHYGSFLVYWLVTVHGLAAGSDSGAPAILALYWVTGAAAYFLVVYRLLVSARPAPLGQPHAQEAAPPPAGGGR